MAKQRKPDQNGSAANPGFKAKLWLAAEKLLPQLLNGTLSAGHVRQLRKVA